MKPLRLEVLGDDGEWHELTGVSGIQLHPSGPDVSDEEWRRHDALDALHFAMTGAQEAVHPKGIDQDGSPIRRTDRPAWQSPYGPPSPR
ncbi:hypothetical protein QBB34_21275 [Streptomyces stelliscabiei]|uniref:hypothetical protein n=1 Tax=Streptomyces stelliscabiei TaxID=146820 RepID=UPI002FEE70EA